MSTLLESFTLEQSKIPYYWGKTDCAKTMDNWLKLNRGYSPLELAGYNYKNKAEADAISKKHGNFLFALLAVAEIDNAVETENPQIGDVAAIVYGPSTICAAIHCGAFWFSRAETGILGAPMGTRVMKAWKLFK